MKAFLARSKQLQRAEVGISPVAELLARCSCILSGTFRFSLQCCNLLLCLLSHCHEGALVLIREHLLLTTAGFSSRYMGSHYAPKTELNRKFNSLHARHQHAGT